MEKFQFKIHVRFSDLKKLIKYEKKSKPVALNGQSQVTNGPENVINVTIIKEATPKRSQQPTTACTVKTVPKIDVQAQTEPTKSEKVDQTKQSKLLLRLPKNIKTKNPKIIYKKGIASGVKNGALVRNTPTDLYQKYQEDWIKFKSYIPGENSRMNVRKSVRQKLQHTQDRDDKVSKRNDRNRFICRMKSKIFNSQF